MTIAGEPFTAAIAGSADGAASLYFRSVDAVLTDTSPALAGNVVSVRRTPTGRRIQIKLAAGEGMVELETDVLTIVKPLARAF